MKIGNLRAKILSLLATSAAATAQVPRDSPALATNSLGLDLYRLEAAPSTRGNLLLSPYSIQSALSMTLGGAAGATRAEMARVLHHGGDLETAWREMAEFGHVLEKAEENSRKLAEEAKKYGERFEPLQLRVANRLFGNEQTEFLAEFLDRTKAEWNAPLERLSFARPDRARQRINGWVEEQTKERIKNLIPDGGLTPDTRLVLVNALYLKAAWLHEFREVNTTKQPFSVNGTTAVPVPTMYQQENFGYLKQPGYTAVTMPYTGMALQFLILLPDTAAGLPALEKTVTAAQLMELSRISMAREVRLWLPKFRIEPPALDLTRHLKSLGMKTAFDDPPGSADFSRMAPRTPQDYLTISAVFHKTFLALDENGTEAAAATAVAAAAGAALGEPEKPAEVHVDRPFLFAIQHRETGLCLFLGRVTDPRAADNP